MECTGGKMLHITYKKQIQMTAAQRNVDNYQLEKSPR